MHAGVGLELVHRVADVGLDRFRRQEQLRRHLLAGQALGEQVRVGRQAAAAAGADKQVAARAVGLGDSIGSLTPGKRADLTVLGLGGSAFLPWEDPVTAAVYGGSPERVLLTMVEGQIRYSRDGEAADTEPVRLVRAKMIER